MGGIKLMIEITTVEEFEDFINQDKHVVVDFYAKWCGPCKQIKPLLERRYDDKIDIAKVDIDEFPTLVDKYGIMSVPKLFIFNGGDIVKENQGNPLAFLKEINKFI